MDIKSFVVGYQKGKASAGGGSPEGFHMVRFFNDDRTTLLYTVFVPTGANAIYAGEAPLSTEDSTLVFVGFDPAATNITGDLNCYASYESIKTLDETSWSAISSLSVMGTADNYFAVGDTKMVHIEGTVGSLEVNGDYGVYILGFDHNKALEGRGITFGTFKSAVSDGANLCLVDSKYGLESTNGTKCFNVNHWGGTNSGGWAGSDMRYDILGSTDTPPSGYGKKVASGRVGYAPSATCATNPVANTLMAALPADLRAVMKPMTKYTCSSGNSNSESNVTVMTDYLSLLTEFEIDGVIYLSNKSEQFKQQRYSYYAAGNSKLKYAHSDSSSAVRWWERSACSTNPSTFCTINESGERWNAMLNTSRGIAPIFKV